MIGRKIFAAVLIVTNFFVSTAFAEILICEGTGEYLLTEETVDFAKNQAELEAQRNILDKICVYVKGNSIMIDNELNEDEVITIATGILHVIDTKFSLDEDSDGILVKSVVTAKIDTDELKILLDNAIKNR